MIYRIYHLLDKLELLENSLSAGGMNIEWAILFLKVEDRQLWVKRLAIIVFGTNKVISMGNGTVPRAPAVTSHF